MPRIALFEKYTRYYDEWFENNAAVYKAELKAIESLIPIRKKGVEIGVGGGRFAAPLNIPIGVEPSGRMAELARKRGIEVHKGVAEKLPYNNEMFDFALMVTTICFVDDVEKAFEEAYRILKPNGALIIGLVDRNSKLGQLYEASKNESLFYSDATFYTVEEVVSFLKNAGFQYFSFAQTLFSDLSKIRTSEPISKGYGKGAFVGISALKPRN